jgi:DNA polymerase III subunit alpha
MAGFTHLHVHSQYSLLGGTAPVTDLARRAAADGIPHLALTDTNGLYGAVAFVQACREAGVQPIVGMTVTVAHPVAGRSPGCLVLLAREPDGYRALCRLSSLIQGHPDREARAARGVTLDDLEADSAGLICLTGGRRGVVERSVRAGEAETARRFARHLSHIYGAPNLYLSLEIHRPEDVAVARELAALGDDLGLPAVAVQPVYCLEPQDVPLLWLLAAIDRNCTLNQVPADALSNGGDPDVGVHWLDPDEMARRFAPFPEALARTSEVAARCGPALPSGAPLWPTLDLPAGQTPAEALATLARAGLARHYGPGPAPAVRQRLERELIAIARYGYDPLFLIVADVVRFARQADVPVSTRGSVANSLVAYCTGITTVDPVAHDLLFERFLSPARADAPGIDLDFCSRRRDEVLDYVRGKYGADRVALVATVSTMRLRSAVRETAKAYGLDETQIERLVSRLPRRWHPDPRRREKQTVEDVLDGIASDRMEKVVQAAFAIRGQPHHLSVHPGGVVIAPGPLTDVLPVQWASKGFLITQFDHRDVERLGLPKIDLLGVSALTVLADGAELVRRDHDPDFRLSDIPLDDVATGEVLARGETVGVFQCESAGARATLRKLLGGRAGASPSIRDLAVANAFFKPGPATGGMAGTFVRRYRGEEPVAYLHPALEPILGATQGVLIFQEQILRVAREVAGLSWAQAGYLRRGMSKMQPEDMAQMEAVFVAGCQRPPPEGAGLTPDQARQLWQQVAVFSGYGFNQGHATAYADVSYRMAYLKAHHPAALMCARLANWGGFHHPAMYMAEAIRLGIEIRPPHVNASGRQCSLTWEEERAILWLGLGQVRHLRRRAVREIAAEQARGPLTGLRDLLRRVSLQSREITHLIQYGALDGLGENRAALLAEAAEVERAGSARQLSLFEEGVGGRMAVARETFAQRLAWERHLLGYPVSALDDPLGAVAERLPARVPLRDLAETAGLPATVAGVRLPGWTGGEGFHLWDGETWVMAKVPGKRSRRPTAWEPLLLEGRWVGDAWGTQWLQVTEIRQIGGE